MPMLIKDRLVFDGGWIERQGVTCFNLYRPPRIELGDASEAGRGSITSANLSRRRRPHHPLARAPRAAPEREDQPRAGAGRRPGHRQGHAARAGQARGRAVELPRRLADASARPFNGFAKVGHPAGQRGARSRRDVNRFSFYDHIKIYTAAPPDVLRVDEKHLREYYVFNVLGVMITTNHKTDGIYLPADDRRHYVAWSPSPKRTSQPEYWDRALGLV